MSRVTKNKNDLVISFKVQIPRTIFLHNLNINEIRLCVLLTSKKELSLSTLNFDEKLYVVGGKHSNLKYINEYGEKLKRIGLITEDGYGVSLRKNNIPSYNLNPIDFYNSKSIKEVFGLCARVWKGKKTTSFAQITEEELENLFTKKYLKRNLKNLNKGLEKFGFQLEYEKTRNNFHQFNVVEVKPFSSEEENTINVSNYDLDLSSIGSIRNDIPEEYFLDF